MRMKKITLILVAGLVAMAAQAGINFDKVSSIGLISTSATVKAETDPVTPPKNWIRYSTPSRDTTPMPTRTRPLRCMLFSTTTTSTSRA